jgi:hypothetical protein
MGPICHSEKKRHVPMQYALVTYLVSRHLCQYQESFRPATKNPIPDSAPAGVAMMMRALRPVPARGARARWYLWTVGAARRSGWSRNLARYILVDISTAAAVLPTCPDLAASPSMVLTVAGSASAVVRLQVPLRASLVQFLSRQRASPPAETHLFYPSRYSDANNSTVERRMDN